MMITMLVSIAFISGCGMASSSSGSKAAGNASGSGKAQITLKAGLGSSLDGSSHGKGLQKFKELIEKESNGRITLQIFPDGQMGNDKSMMEAMQMGTLDMSAVSTSPVSEFTKGFLVFDLPFLFTTEAEADKVLDSPAGQKILDSLKTVNLVGLTYWENGFRNLTNSKRPINRVSDLQGLKIRTMQNPIMLETFKLWGANPTPMAFNEVFTALEQKTIDGQENPNPLIFDAGFYEAQKYLTISRHFYTPYVLLIGQKSMDKLSKEDQELIRKVAKETTAYERQVNRDMTKDALQKMKDKGIIVNELSPEAIQEFKDSSKAIYDKFAGEIGKDTMDSILAELKK